MINQKFVNLSQRPKWCIKRKWSTAAYDICLQSRMNQMNFMRVFVVPSTLPNALSVSTEKHKYSMIFVCSVLFIGMNEAAMS